MADEQFKPGDVVQLKSGGPLMTIAHYASDFEQFWCEWFDGKKEKGHHFSPAVLKKVSEDDDS